MRVVVNHQGLRDLESDLRKLGPMMVREGADLVRRNVLEGRKAAQQHARAASGPHGKKYWKRITSDMIGVMIGEYGPHDGGTPVGAGYRDGPPNTDLESSLDVMRPKLYRDVDKMLGRLFWPGAE